MLQPPVTPRVHHALLPPRFAYATGPWHRKELRSFYNHNQRDARGYAFHPLAPLQRFPFANDAFHTILQFLHGRIKTITRLTDAELAAQADEERRRSSGGGSGVQGASSSSAPQATAASLFASFFG